MESIRASLGGVGNITKAGMDSISYRVTSLKDLTQVVIPHFDKYPLISKKRADYELFKQVVELMNRKEHLTPDGFQKIVAIKASMNLGLPDELNTAFPNISPLPRPLVQLPEKIDPHWLAGFVSGEACFSIIIRKSSSSRTREGERVSLIFRITQHSRDIELMQSLVPYFGCGQYEFVTGRDLGNFGVKNFTHITEKIIPFFDTPVFEGS